MSLMPTYTDLTSFLISYGFTANNITPLMVLGTVLYIAIRNTIMPSIESVEKRVGTIEYCIVEIQTIMKTKFKGLTLEHSIKTYSVSNSPLILKEEFKPIFLKTGLADQIQNKESAILELVKKYNPKTGLDAQDVIVNLVLSDEISVILDLTVYKQYLYKEGKVTEDAMSMLAIYLFEFIIPKLQL